MMTTPDDLRRDALDTITGQCRRLCENAKYMNEEQLKAEIGALQKSIGILGIIEGYVMKGGATA